MKLVTWNVNSLKVRMPRVLEFLELHAPDVVCLQETKCEPDAFPAMELEAAGYASVHHSGGRWAGVAVLAREGLVMEEAGTGLAGEPGPDEARWVEAKVGDLRVISTYVINGRAVGSPFFADKLRFLEAAAERAGELREAGERVALAGDFNVTRDDRDVYDPAAFEGETHVTPQERVAFEAILDRGGLTDAYRALHDGEQFTWWDYRQGHFHRGLGLRIDYILLSGALAGSLTACHIERDFRKGPKPSDHAPLVAEWRVGEAQARNSPLGNTCANIRSCPTSSCTATPPTRSSTAPRTRRRSPGLRLSRATPRWRPPTTTGCTGRWRPRRR